MNQEEQVKVLLERIINFTMFINIVYLFFIIALAVIVSLFSLLFGGAFGFFHPFTLIYLIITFIFFISLIGHRVLFRIIPLYTNRKRLLHLTSKNSEIDSLNINANKNLITTLKHSNESLIEPPLAVTFKFKDGKRIKLILCIKDFVNLHQLVNSTNPNIKLDNHNLIHSSSIHTQQPTNTTKKQYPMTFLSIFGGLIWFFSFFLYLFFLLIIISIEFTPTTPLILFMGTSIFIGGVATSLLCYYIDWKFFHCQDKFITETFYRGKKTVLAAVGIFTAAVIIGILKLVVSNIIKKFF